MACQSGRVFPLTEGMTGVVVARLIRYVAAVHVVIAGEPYWGAAERSRPAPTRSLMSRSKPSSPTCLSGPATMWRSWSTGSVAPRSASCTCCTGTRTNCWRSAASRPPELRRKLLHLARHGGHVHHAQPPRPGDRRIARPPRGDRDPDLLTARPTGRGGPARRHVTLVPSSSSHTRVSAAGSRPAERTSHTKAQA